MPTKCVSQCPSCGTVCASFPVTDADSATYYASKHCTVIHGDLFVTNIPSSVLEVLLLDLFSDVRVIRGNIYVNNNLFLTSLSFLGNLTSVNGISLLNNPNLVDASLPSLTSLNGDVTVKGCFRLCPARYPRLSTDPVPLTSLSTRCPNLKVCLSFSPIPG